MHGDLTFTYKRSITRYWLDLDCLMNRNNSNSTDNQPSLATMTATTSTAAVMKMPIVSKLYCSSAQTVLVVRKRPNVVNGGGFVVTDCTQKVVFRVDGCGIIGKKGELMLRDGNGTDLLLIRQKGGIIQALSIQKQWRGFAYDYEGLRQKLVFSLREPSSFRLSSSSSSSSKRDSIRIWVQLPGSNSCSSSTVPFGCGGGQNSNNWDFETRGSFPDKSCTIVDNHGNIISQIGVAEGIEQVFTNKDVYHVVVRPGIDQAFVFGVISVLDYIYKESTRC